MKRIEFRLKENNTAISYWKGNSKHSIIFCSGLPQYVTSYSPFVESLLSLEFNLLIPKYEGSWESGGDFNLRSSIQSVVDTFLLLKNGKAIELYGNSEIVLPKGSVVLVGFSYGSLVALLASSKIDCDKIILIAPFCNIHEYGENELMKDLSFIARGYENVYRFKPETLLSELRKVSYPSKVNNMTVAKCLYDKTTLNDVSWLIEKYSVKVVEVEAGHTSNLSVLDYEKLLK